jgi:putative transposase
MHWVCYAYCFMPNHYQLVIETLAPNLSTGMRQLKGVYTQRFNRHHGRVGHVFQGATRPFLWTANPISWS